MIAVHTAAPPPESSVTRPPLLSVVRACTPDTDPDTVTVCGKRSDFRLPLPIGRDEGEAYARASGDVPAGAAALDPGGRCGMFAGERRCRRKEAELYGYGGGRDPITVLSKLGAKLLDPDAE